MRLSQCIEACDADLNATATSSLSEDGLRRMLWCVTRQRPLVPLANLQVKLYNELFGRLLVRHQQLMRQTQLPTGEYSDSVIAKQCKELKSEPELTDELVKQLSESFGFDQRWLDDFHRIVTLKQSVPRAKSRATAKSGAPSAAIPELLQARPLTAGDPSPIIEAFAKAAPPQAHAGMLRMQPPPAVPVTPAMAPAAVTLPAKAAPAEVPAPAAAVTEPEPGAVPAPFDDDAVTAAAADHSDSLPPEVPDYATVTAADASHVED